MGTGQMTRIGYDDIDRIDLVLIREKLRKTLAYAEDDLANARYNVERLSKRYAEAEVERQKQEQAITDIKRELAEVSAKIERIDG
jgi:predicted  nucleic acid-binding Zn-ribbon protein